MMLMMPVIMMMAMVMMMMMMMMMMVMVMVMMMMVMVMMALTHKYDSCDRLSLHARPGAERPRHHSAPSPAPSPSSLLRGYSLTAVTDTAEHLPYPIIPLACNIIPPAGDDFAAAARRGRVTLG